MPSPRPILRVINDRQPRRSAGGCTAGNSMAFVLVADDDPSVRMVLRHVLEKHGHRVWEASDGDAAVYHAVSRDFDVLFLDMVMIRKGGWQTAREVLQEKPGQRIVLMSGIVGMDSADFQTEAQALGIRTCLTKPFEEAEIVEAVNRELGAEGR
jgi:CheY-like chemotaxis protein